MSTHWLRKLLRCSIAQARTRRTPPTRKPKELERILRNSWILFFISVGPQNCDLDKRQFFGKPPGEKSNIIMPSSPTKKARVGSDKSEKAAAKIQGASELENAQGTDPEQILKRCPQNKIPNLKLTLDKPNFGSFSAK